MRWTVSFTHSSTSFNEKRGKWWGNSLGSSVKTVVDFEVDGEEGEGRHWEVKARLLKFMAIYVIKLYYV